MYNYFLRTRHEWRTSPLYSRADFDPVHFKDIDRIEYYRQGSACIDIPPSLSNTTLVTLGAVYAMSVGTDGSPQTLHCGAMVYVPAAFWRLGLRLVLRPANQRRPFAPLIVLTCRSPPDDDDDVSAATESHTLPTDAAGPAQAQHPSAAEAQAQAWPRRRRLRTTR